MKKNYALAVVMALATIGPVSATPLLGSDLVDFSVLAGGYATYGAGAVVSDQIGAVSYVVGGAGSSSGGDNVDNASVNGALSDLKAAQSALNMMEITNMLGATIGGTVSLAPGVYSASALTMAAGTILSLDGGGLDNPTWVFNIGTYLVTGDSTVINVLNAGANASVIWNAAGYVVIGANTDFIGTIMSGDAITEGAGSNFSCGNMFAQSYVSVAANSTLTSTSCASIGNWDGAVGGLAANMEIVDGVAQARAPTEIDEPATILLLGTGLAMIVFFNKRRSAKAGPAYKARLLPEPARKAVLMKSLS